MIGPRRYRVVPSEKAGYAPGLSVLQYFDPDIRVWFDIGDPKSEAEAQAQLSARKKEGES